MIAKKLKRVSFNAFLSIAFIFSMTLLFSPQEVLASENMRNSCYQQTIQPTATSCGATREVCPRRFLWITWWTDYGDWQFFGCPGGALSGDTNIN